MFDRFGATTLTQTTTPSIHPSSRYVVVLSSLVCVLATTYHGHSMQAYDGHMNMVLSEVEEQISTLEVDEVTNEEKIKVSASRPWAGLRWTRRRW